MSDDQKDNESTHQIDGIVEDRQRKPPIYFKILYFGLIAWALVFMAYYLLSGWSSQEEFKQQMSAFRAETTSAESAPPASVPSAPVAAPPIDAAALYSENCAICHGEKGEGGIGPDLRSENFEYGLSTQQISQSITQGRPGGMPAFGNQLSSDKIGALAAFVLGLK